MATPETIGVTSCDRCKRDVDVKLNSGGFGYYHCGCGWSGRSHNQSASRSFLQNSVKPVNLYEQPEQPAPGAPETTDKPTPAPAGFRYF